MRALLAISVLLVAANAGIVGLSRITYAMSKEGAIPEVFSNIHPKYRTPLVSIMFFSWLTIFIVLPFGAHPDILAEMNNFGGLLAYMTGLSLIALRNKEKNLVRPVQS